jgi:hypothetical protein
VAGSDQCGEVADPVDVVLGQQPPAQLLDIEPLIRRALQTAIEQVEAIDVDVGAHRR